MLRKVPSNHNSNLIQTNICIKVEPSYSSSLQRWRCFSYVQAIIWSPLFEVDFCRFELAAILCTILKGLLFAWLIFSAFPKHNNGCTLYVHLREKRTFYSCMYPRRIRSFTNMYLQIKLCLVPRWCIRLM